MRGILYLLYALQSLANAWLAGQKKQREIDRAAQEALARVVDLPARERLAPGQRAGALPPGSHTVPGGHPGGCGGRVPRATVRE